VAVEKILDVAARAFDLGASGADVSEIARYQANGLQDERPEDPKHEPEL